MNPRIEKHLKNIQEAVDEVITYYFVNKQVPQDNYLENLAMKTEYLCQQAIEYGIGCTQDGLMRTEQFQRYGWKTEHTFKENDIFKIIGDIYKMIDDDEYFFKPKSSS